MPISFPIDDIVPFSPFTQPVIVLIGPTAIGKTGLSIEMAKVFDCEIVSMDSMQVYRYMDIGTAKATEEERDGVSHHLIDIVNPDEDYDAKHFVTDACKAVDDIHARNRIPLITGGTGLYLRALTSGLFACGKQYPEIRSHLKARLREEGSSVLYNELRLCDTSSAQRIHKNDTQRVIRALEIYLGTGIPWSQHILQQAAEKERLLFHKLLLLGIACKRELLYERINRRCEIMVEQGLEAEVRGLLERGYSPHLKSMMSIGYRHMTNYIQGEWTRERMEQLLARDTRHYAKRQLTWFQHTSGIEWFEREGKNKIIDFTKRWISL